jgi:hypothetical protein
MNNLINNNKVSNYIDIVFLHISILVHHTSIYDLPNIRLEIEQDYYVDMFYNLTIIDDKSKEINVRHKHGDTCYFLGKYP